MFLTDVFWLFVPNFAENGAWSHPTVISAPRTATAPSLYNLSENKRLRQSFAQLAPYDSLSSLRPCWSMHLKFAFLI